LLVWQAPKAKSNKVIAMRMYECFIFYVYNSIKNKSFYFKGKNILHNFF